jgi:hypothetical protein
MKEIEAKAKGQLRLQLNGIFRPLVAMGNDVAGSNGAQWNWLRDEFAINAIAQCERLAVWYHRRMNGEDIPLEEIE